MMNKCKIHIIKKRHDKCTCKTVRTNQIISDNFNKNLNLYDLKDKLKDSLDELIYFYVLTTTSYENNKIVQKGSAPNFEGGIITLCTCKHRMRTYPDVKKDVWIAGITNKYTGPNSNNGERVGNHLFYLFKIEQYFESQFDLYQYLKDKESEAFKKKTAEQNVFGDLYTPLKNISDKHNSKNYLPINDKHVHFRDEIWKYDIEKYNDKEHKLLLGHRGKESNFVWNEPKIKLNYDVFITQGARKLYLKDFLKLFHSNKIN